MLRYRLALVAAGILLLTAPSAWAFSQQNAGSSGDGNSSFSDPDDQITNNFGVRLNEQPCSSVSSSNVHLIPFGGSNRYTATALIIRRAGLATERGCISPLHPKHHTMSASPPKADLD